MLPPCCSSHILFAVCTYSASPMLPLCIPFLPCCYPKMQGHDNPKVPRRTFWMCITFSNQFHPCHLPPPPEEKTSRMLWFHTSHIRTSSSCQECPRNSATSLECVRAQLVIDAFLLTRRHSRHSFTLGRRSTATHLTRRDLRANYQQS